MGKALERAALVLPRGYLHGLTLSTAGSSATFSVALGEAVDDSFTSLMTTAGLSKTTSAWAVGTAAGSLDTGSIAASTWYHVYLIKRPDTGVVDVLTSLSATAPTMPTNYTLKRRIGSMKTNASSQWTKFVQVGDEFLWDIPALDVAVTIIGTTALTPTLASVPSGVQVGAILQGGFYNVSTTTANAAVISSLDQTDTAPVVNGIGTTINSASAGMYEPIYATIRTNTSQQVRARTSTAGNSYILTTMGWVDTRGKLS